MNKRILGYTDKLSVAPGDSLEAKVSCYGVSKYRASVVRLIHGDLNPAGPGFKAQPIPAFPEVERMGREQKIYPGSYVIVDTPGIREFSDGITLQAFVWPTTPGSSEQDIVSWAGERGNGISLGLDDAGRVCVSVGEEVIITSSDKLARKHWYLLAASVDLSQKTVELHVEPLGGNIEAYGSAIANFSAERIQVSGPLLFAARFATDSEGRAAPTRHFNGKIDRPRICARALTRGEIGDVAVSRPTRKSTAKTLGAWDFSLKMTTPVVVDFSGNGLDGRCVHLPARAMKGANWTGEVMSWTERPDEYSAIHFHDDDIYDAEWETDFELRVPSDLKSGVYAIRLLSDEAEDYIPFFVRPSRGKTADVVFVAPTMSYLAYANEHMPTDAPLAQLLTGQVVPMQPNDLFLAEHREFGGSTYDTHSDGSGVCYSSRLRPILNMRPKYAMWLGGSGSSLWQFNADLHITDWLEESGYEFDVITDEDLHEQGYSALSPYRVVITGTHAEYTTESMRDAYELFTQRGGRLMYMSGNGFYWRTSASAEFPGAMEVRKAEGGIRAWAAEPGEYYNSFTGEYSGLWRRSGRAPQELVGVGFISQGFDISAPYKRLDDSRNPRASFIFAGVEDEILGDFGLIGGGAAGLELDHVDFELGSPPHTLKLATSQGFHTDIYMVVVEEILINQPGLTGTQSPLVAADMCFFECPGGGAVWSTGSIAYCGSLSHNDYDNNISRMTRNVLDRFLDPEPFEMPVPPA